ncbi:MAG TPA: hypothetical protein PKY35_01785 [Candidatus Hydrogenedentes bacterium]|nr:hypothetical protein [Candidatus Hydrogenedentota bacterium]HOL75733.1 hypothetical protein [Candidatus Hydrogenedentota bacterium]HPO84274.1 hypothetical protein [Candidatus Hydrogenedentota bacterium]
MKRGLAALQLHVTCLEKTLYQEKTILKTIGGIPVGVDTAVMCTCVHCMRYYRAAHLSSNGALLLRKKNTAFKPRVTIPKPL